MCTFPSKTCRFLNARLTEIGNAQNDLRMTLSNELSKVPCIH